MSLAAFSFSFSLSQVLVRSAVRQHSLLNGGGAESGRSRAVMGAAADGGVELALWLEFILFNRSRISGCLSGVAIAPDWWHRHRNALVALVDVSLIQRTTQP